MASGLPVSVYLNVRFGSLCLGMLAGEGSWSALDYGGHRNQHGGDSWVVWATVQLEASAGTRA